ncbi:hypothetical protein R6Q57_011077 [Mikania cordata]
MAGDEFVPTLPQPGQSVNDCPPGFVALYTRFFDFSNLRFPLARFCCNALEYYQLSLSQLDPFGVSKITHFEMACKALEIPPTMALFRRFFNLAKNGVWFTIQRRKMDDESQCVFIVTPSVKDWKNQFFWVSSKILPFEPFFRDPKEPVYEISLLDSTINLDYHRLLVANKTHMRSFSEEMLVLGGLSRYWDKPDRMPTFTRRGSAMGFLDLMKMDTNSDVESSSRPLHDGEEDVLSSHKKVAYEGGEYSSILSSVIPTRCELPKVNIGDVAEPCSLKRKKSKGSKKRSQDVC